MRPSRASSARRSSTRCATHIVFRFDPAITGAARVSGIVDQVKKERIARTGTEAV